MSNYTPIIENSQPLAHYNCNDLSGDIVDNVNALDFVDNSLITYQQDGALLGETANKAILLSGILETANTLNTSNFGTGFACEFWVKPDSSFTLNIGDGFNFALTDTNEIVLSGIDWHQRGTVLQAGDATANDLFGFGMDVSGDGNVLAVGIRGRTTNTGGVYIYDKVGDSWVQRGVLLQASDAQTNDYYGLSCTLSYDGEILVVGAHAREVGTNADYGAVYTYDRSGATWVERNILEADDKVTSDTFGFSCSLSSDGDVLVVGANGRNSGGDNKGGLYTYDRSGATWVQRGVVLVAADAADNDDFGVSCALNGSGDVLTVSSLHLPYGTVYVYDRNGTAWTERNKLVTPEGTLTGFGYGTSLSSDGNTLVAGHIGNEAVYTYRNDGIGGWDQVNKVSTNVLVDNGYGKEIAITSNAHQLIVAGYNYSAGLGGVFSYDIKGTGQKIIKDVYNHIVLNYHDDTLGVYLNGKLYHISEQTQLFNSNEYLRIQGDATIDELALYDTRLSDVEIDARFNNAKQFDLVEANISNSKPIAYFPMADINDDMQSWHGNIKGKYHNSPTLNQIGKHKKSVLFDGVNQYAEIYNPSIIDSNMVLLLHGNGDNNSTVFVDDSVAKNNIIVNGNVKVSTTESKFKQAIYFDGTGDYLKIIDTENFGFGLDDFTADCWIFLDGNIGSHKMILDFRDAGNTVGALYVDGGSEQLAFTDGLNGYIGTVLNHSQWYHVALERDAGTLNVYLDGVLDITTNNVIDFSTSSRLGIGAYPGNGGEAINGYIDEIRIVKGVAIYQGNFTPMTTEYDNQVEPIPTSIGDEHFDGAILLMHMDGVHLGTAFRDSSNARLPLTAAGSAKISDTQAKFGTTSARFDGNGDSVDISNKENTHLSKYDFTIELQLYKAIAHDGTNECLISRWSGTGANCEFHFSLTATHVVFAMRKDDRSTYIGTLLWNWIPTLNVWHHIALCKSDTSYTLFIDGVSLGTIVEAARMNTYNSIMHIGRLGNSSSSTYYLEGWIDELRITRGTARYTENFTPPTKQFPDTGLSHNDWEFGKSKDKHWFDTVYLEDYESDSGSNMFYDHSYYRHGTSEAGSTHATTSSKKFGNTSVRFDGSGDYIIENGIADRLAGINNFAIEAWYRNENNNASVALWAFNGSSGSINRFGLWTNTFSLTFGGNTGYSYNIPIITTAGTWVHIAVVYDNGYLKIFKDGVSVLSKYSGNNTISTADTFRIATELDSSNTPGNYLHGNCDDFRVTWDVIRYTDEFEPPIRANPIGYGKFEHTVECWFNMVSVTGGSFNTIFSKGTDSENALVIQDSVFSSTGTIQYFYNGNLSVTGTDIALGLATWNHIAVTFEQYSIIIFLNGSAIARLENIAPDITNKSFFIGSDSNNTYPSNAYISDFTIHDRALTPHEIHNRYNAFENVNTESATLYYDLIKQLGATNYYKCDATGNVFVDEFGGKHGKIFNYSSANVGNSLIPADAENKSYSVAGSHMRLTQNLSTYTLPATISITVNIKQYQTVNTLWVLKGGGVTAEVDGNGVYDSTIMGFQESDDATHPNEFYFWSITDGLSHYLGFVPNLNQTYHLTLVMNTGNLSLYVDGVLYTSLNITVSNIGKISAIGRDVAVHPGALEDFEVDEILAFTNRSLTPNEVYKLYSASTLSLADKQNYYDYIDNLAPIHYYKLNDNSTVISDSVGSYDGVLSGTAFNQDADGILNVDPLNKAVYFQTSAKIEYPNTVVLPSTVTFSFYIRKGNSNTTKKEIAHFNGSVMYVMDGGNNIRWWDGSSVTNSPVNLSNTETQHILFTWNGTNLKWYVNGAYVGVNTIASNINGFNRLGTTTFDTEFTLDEVLLFDRVLSDFEIETLYDKGNKIDFGTSIPDYDALVTSLAPIHYYKMNDLSLPLADEIGGRDGSADLSGYQLQRNSLINDLTNKSTKLTATQLNWDPVINTAAGSHTFNIMIMFHELPSVLANNNSIIAAANTSGFYIDNTNNELGYYDGSLTYLSGTSIEIGVRYFYTAITTPTNVKIYLNGELIMNSVIAHNFDDFNRIGKDNWAGSITVDEFMIFDKELSVIEINRLYQSSVSTISKNKSYDDFLYYSQPFNYYPLSETTTEIFDQVGDNGGTLSGVSFTQQYNSMMYSDTNNKSTLLTNAEITLNANKSVIVRTLSFIVKVISLPTTENISLVSGPTKALAYIDFPSNRLAYFDSTTRYSPLIFETGKTYHIIVNYFNGYVDWYVDGKKLDIQITQDNAVTDSILTADTIDLISEVNGNVALDQVVVYSDRNLSESEIYQVFELQKYDFELLTGYRIRGTTSIEGAYRALDVRLYQHSTGGFLSGIVSDSNGYYEFTGLHQNLEYDLVFFEEGKYTTCQEVYMAVLPESYQY